MSELASNFTSDPEIKAELLNMLKEKDLEGRIRYLKEDRNLAVDYEWDPSNMHVTFSIKSNDGKMFRAMANSKKMALTLCYTGYLDKINK